MKNRFSYVGLIILQAAARLGFIVAAYFALTGKQPLLPGIAAGALLLFVLMPLRFILGAWMGDRAQGTENGAVVYPKRVGQGLLRFARGIVYSLPFFGLTGYLLHVFQTQPFNKFGQFVSRFSVVIFAGNSAEAGLAGVAVVLVLLALAGVIGWRRDLGMEYLENTAARNAKQLIKGARLVRRKGRNKLLSVTAVNLLIALPGLVIFILVLVPYVSGKMALAGNNMMLMLQLGLDLIKKPLPAQQVAMLAGGYFLVYAPLQVWRKMRLAKTVRSIRIRNQKNAIG